MLSLTPLGDGIPFLWKLMVFCVFQVSPYGLPPLSFLTISVMFMSILESVTGVVLHQPKMAHVPTPGGWKVRLIRTITRHVPPLFFSISWLWFPLCWLYSPEAGGKSLRRNGAKSEKLTTVLPIVQVEQTFPELLFCARKYKIKDPSSAHWKIHL